MQIEDLISFGSANQALVESFYAQYQQNPWSINQSWRKLFDQIEIAYPSDSKQTVLHLRLCALIQAYRKYGHLSANINPLSSSSPVEVPELNFQSFGFRSEDLLTSCPTFGCLEKKEAPLRDVIAALRSIYCESVGVEYTTKGDSPLDCWLQSRIEKERVKQTSRSEEKKRILKDLNKSELLESFLHTKYPGQKRFSLEGCETLIPVLAAVIDKGAELGIKNFYLGMAHRGRLNVLSNIMQKSYGQIFSEFEEGYTPDPSESSGDVKYHKGFSSTIETASGHVVNVFLSPNPSHLESVNPVVQGQVRALQTIENDEERKRSIAILIHGDAALSGQGVVYETLQMSKLDGFTVGGTIHLVINNQIGFTTTPKDSRSTRYCTDIAKTFDSPVFHVNVEDPESAVFLGCLAIEARQEFKSDVFVDLVGYRKYGHNESDEPGFTQPIEYQIIRNKKSIREQYLHSLIHQGVIEKNLAGSLEEEFKVELQNALDQKKSANNLSPNQKEVKENGYLKETAVSENDLREIGKALFKIPEGFVFHKKIEKFIHERLEMSEGKVPLDWGMGETLAYATLLWAGTDVRITGQDCCRGTFSHRHAVWVDQLREKNYYPLQHLKKDQGRFDIFNSALSEFADLGFAFGYSLRHFESLVVWEAQFGDFSNGAQVVIDQYITTAKSKWGQKSRLVLLLPHGYEGQGPEHSSARIERFCSLCGNQNMVLANPTTPAQFFHLLRRQMLSSFSVPLIVFTPKGLLRHPECTSQISELSQGAFQEIIDDTTLKSPVKKVVFCSGHIYYDLLAERKKRAVNHLAIVRIEQFYPFPLEELKKVMEKYVGFEECFWVQEEPRNMGAWSFVSEYLEAVCPVDYIGREKSASPATGSSAVHKKELEELIKRVFK